jgi:hypothetical protein
MIYQSKPLCDSTVMRACAASALAETVGSVAALCGSSLWSACAILRSLDNLSLAVQVSAIVRAICLRVFRLRIVSSGWSCI